VPQVSAGAVPNHFLMTGKAANARYGERVGSAKSWMFGRERPRWVDYLMAEDREGAPPEGRGLKWLR
jgi:hypothetical protein